MIHEGSLRRYGLTQLGNETKRRIYRRDAKCPVIVHPRTIRDRPRRAVAGLVVYISEDGCLITSDHFPDRVVDLYIIFPGLKAKVFGKIRSQGDYTLSVQFSQRLPEDIVDRIARVTTVD